MKSIHRTFALLACIALSFLSACRSNPAPTAIANDDPGVRAWMDSFQKAFTAKDANAVMALYTPDVLAYDIVPPLQYIGSDEYRKDIEGFFKQFQGPVSIEFNDVHIQVSGDLAIVECLQHLTATSTDGQKIDSWSRVTAGLRRVNGQWLDFHDHISVPVDLNTGKAVLDLKP